MRFFYRNYWIFIVIFSFAIALFVWFIVKNNIKKNNITSLEFNEVKKQLNIPLFRYEKDIFSLDMNRLQEEMERLSKIYPPFFIEPDSWNDSAWMDALKAYLQDTIMIALHNSAEKVIKTDHILKQLETAFAYYKVFYPNYSIPNIITMIQGDTYIPSVYFLSEDIIIVNVDMYLGAEDPYYAMDALPIYIIERCDVSFLPIDIFKKAMVYKHLPQMPRATLLDAMITEGKKLYFTEMMFPDVHERLIIGYSEEKYQWANHYLGNAWSYIIEKNELFGKGESLMRCYIEEAPFTKPFGNNSPARLGAFIGWKLIQSYMKNNPEITLQELMEDVDYQKVLNNSKFKPQPK
jgi:hypothetical protein